MRTKAEAYKRTEQQAWDSFSRRYTKIALPEFQPYGDRLVQMASLRRGMWVLDVATGPGEPALTAARRVGLRGLVLGIDFSPAMLRTAASRARQSGIRNVQFRHMDAEHLKLPGMMFERVFCRFGLMLMPNAQKALRETYRVLVPGGRVAVAVWSAQSKVNTLGIVREVLVRHRAFTPPPGAPDFFRFGKAGAIERALKTAGFRDIQSRRMTIEWVFADANNFWNSMKQGPSLKRSLVGLSPALRRTIKEEVARRLERFRRGNALRIPNEAVLAVGRKR
ncbi:MAG: methyltransferase domain-containing protein [Nitrospirae bacterium]|nr:MAG: methyltransferase domain-containing protein [Nitrospirota bacterium]